MATKRYFPSAEAEQISWLQNYKIKIAAHLTTLGMSSEAPSTAYDLGHALYVLETWYPGVQNDAKEATAYKNNLLNSPTPGQPSASIPAATSFPTAPTAVSPGIYKRLFAQVQRIKVNAAYSAAIGEDLQIVGAEDSAVHLTPEFVATVQDSPEGQFVRLKFTKFGHDGVFIQSRRNAGAWENLMPDMISPFEDTRPLLAPGTAETREYRMSFYDGGEANGDWTDVAKVTVGG